MSGWVTHRKALDYQGLSCLSVESPLIRLDYLVAAGPRLIRLFLSGSNENWLAETPDLSWETPYGQYNILGGHRFWFAPQSQELSYFPDNQPIEVLQSSTGVTLTQPVETISGLQKSLTIQLSATRARLKLTHQVKNLSENAYTLSVWPITQLKGGGEIILPTRSKDSDHPTHQPDRLLVHWPYTPSNDPRICNNDSFLYIHGAPMDHEMKIGLLNYQGWMAYYRNGYCFVKCFYPQADQAHPDLGCNTEVYCKGNYVELETLSPNIDLKPGESAQHIETWEILPAPLSFSDLETLAHFLQDTIQLPDSDE